MKEGWQVKKLGEVCAINYGYTESASNDPVGPKFLRITDIQNDSVDWDSVPYCKAEASDLSKFVLADGDIVFARTGATTGKSFLVKKPPEAVFASYLIRLRILDRALMPEFVSLFFKTSEYWQAVKDGSSGSAQGGFNAAKLGDLSLPAPTYPEQQHIVVLLDETFEAIATAKAHAEQNLKNARALFESQLDAVFRQRGEGWEETTLNDVASIRNGFAFKSNDFSENGPTKSIKITNVGVREFVETSDRGLPAKFAEKFASVSAPAGSLVIALTRTIIADGLKVAIVPSAYDQALVNQRVAALLPKSEQASASYLFAYFSTSIVLNYVKERVNTLMQPNLSINDLRIMPIPLPPTNERERIVDALLAFQGESQRLEGLYRRKIAALDELKASLLHKAFAGEL